METTHTHGRGFLGSITNFFTHTSSKGLFLSCVAVALFISVCSTALTGMFFFGFGVGFAAIMLAVIGVTMECCKIIAPALCLRFHARRGFLMSFLFFVLAAGLSGISFSASVVALERVVMLPESSASSTASTELDNEILLQQQYVEELRVQAEEQRALGHITKRDATLASLERALERLSDLRAEKQGIEPETLMSMHGAMIIRLIAGLMEVVSILMVVTLHYLSTAAVKGGNQPSPTPDPSGRRKFSDVDTSASGQPHYVSGQQTQEIGPLVASVVAALQQVNEQSKTQTVASGTEPVSEKAIDTPPATQEVANAPQEAVEPTVAVTAVVESNEVSPATTEGTLADAPVSLPQAESKRGTLKLVEAEPSPVAEQTQVEVLSDKEWELRVAILSAQCAPSMRGCMPITSNRAMIREACEELHRDGFLERKGGGAYKLVRALTEEQYRELRANQGLMVASG